MKSLVKDVTTQSYTFALKEFFQKVLS